MSSSRDDQHLVLRSCWYSATPTNSPVCTACWSPRSSAVRVPIGTAVLVCGLLGDQVRTEINAEHGVAIVHTDYVTQVSLLTHLAAAMHRADKGLLVVFSFGG